VFAAIAATSLLRTRLCDPGRHRSDQSGTFKDYMLLYRWSTVDSRMLSRPQSNEGASDWLSEGRELNLEPLESCR